MFKRITEKRVCGQYIIPKISLSLAKTKLGIIEDLEDKLGIGIVELFNIILNVKEIFYIIPKHNNIIDKAFVKSHKLPEHRNFQLEYFKNRFCIVDSIIFIEEIKNFNKTWFLTEQQAQDYLKEKEDE